VDLFTYLSGSWIVPESFYRWTAISLMAACVEDRVWLQEMDHAPLKPNVWVFLIGPQGTGKDVAIGLGQALLQPEDPMWVIDGRVTYPALMDYMVRQQTASGRSGAPVFLISSEVTESLPIGVEGQDFITRALPLYGGRERTTRDITRTSGDKIVYSPLLNWILGCTEDWFPRAIDPLVFNSGLAGRMAFVVGKPVLENYHKRAPTRRHDHDEVWDFLRRQVEAFQTVEGPFVMDDVAKIAYEQWLFQQKDRLLNATLSDTEKHIASRLRTTLLKLAMLFTLSEWQGGLLVIRVTAIQRSVIALREIIDGVLRVSNFAYTTLDTAPLERVRDIIKERGSMWAREILTYGISRGVRDSQHLRSIFSTLEEMGVIKVVRVKPKRGGRWPERVSWISKKMYLGSPKEDVDDDEEPYEEDTTTDDSNNKTS